MAQFDVHQESSRTRIGTSYFVVVQSRCYDSYPRRAAILPELLYSIDDIPDRA